MNIACTTPIESRPFEVDFRMRNMMASRALRLRLERLHYEHAPDAYKSRFLPALPLPDIAVKPKPSSLFLQLWGEQELEAPPVTVQQIKQEVSRYFKVTITDLVSARRTKDIVVPRQIAMYLCRHLTTCTLPGIGRNLGGRDHTTILYGVSRVENLLIWNREVVHAVATIRKRLS